ncbi:MAG: TRAP transporter large permease subunit [Deltaproteobacteria bacterium]|nr:TRAP transporter large permease subunit [Deltaproteobacteria bacterium]
MESLFLALLVLAMATALASGFPVAFALPGSAILTIGLAALTGYIFTGDTHSFFAQDGPVQWLTAGVTNFRGVYWEVERDTIIAVPLFVFMGIMLQRSKIAEDLLVTMARLFGPIPGGLGISVVLVGALLAATTGILGATVVAMGLISLPAMLRNGYSRQLATGTISAAGTLGQIIPPSVVLIILADQLSNATDQASTLRQVDYKAATGNFVMPTEFDITSASAGDMFLGAIVPGLVLVGLYVMYILAVALIRPSMAPAIPLEGRFDRQFAVRVVLALVPPLALILAVLGSIIAGIATVNQAGAIGAVGATIMAGYRLTEGQRGSYTPAIIAGVSLIALFVLLATVDLNIRTIHSVSEAVGVTAAAIAVAGLLVSVAWSGWRAYRTENMLAGVMVETAKTTAMVFIILLGAAMLTAAFRGFGGEELVKEFLTTLPGGFWTQFIVVMAVIFVLGFFLDFIEIAVVVVPIVAPILLSDPSANITAVWLGVMIGVNMQTSFLTPPFGFALFYLRGVAPPSVLTTDIYRGVVAFIVLQLVALGIVGFYPPLVNYLPARTSLTGETAPPPRNPRLQRCLEQNLFEIYDRDGDAIRASIRTARGLDTSYLPDKLRRSLTSGMEKAARTFDLVAEVRRTDAERSAFGETYKSTHAVVRRINADERRIDREVREIRTTIRRLGRDADPEVVAPLRHEVEELTKRRAEVEATRPEGEKELHKRYLALEKKENTARRNYRRNVDDAASSVLTVREMLAKVPELEAAGAGLRALPEMVTTQPAQQAGSAIRDAERSLRTVPGTHDLRDALSKARSDLRRGASGRQRAEKRLGEALARLEREIEWRTRAARDLDPGLAEYEHALRDTIGIRQLERLPTPMAKEVAACLSRHRDISLSF